MEITDFLRRVSLFSNLSDRNLKRLGRACSTRKVSSNDLTSARMMKRLGFLSLFLERLES